jgi:hypothetical protein
MKIHNNPVCLYAISPYVLAISHSDGIDIASFPVLDTCVTLLCAEVSAGES